MRFELIKTFLMCKDLQLQSEFASCVFGMRDGFGKCLEKSLEHIWSFVTLLKERRRGRRWRGEVGAREDREEGAGGERDTVPVSTLP